MQRQITIFKNITVTTEPFYPTVSVIVDRIKRGKSKALIKKIRTIPEKKERDIYKKQLPSICFSGIFDKRANESVKTHTGLVAIDFDHLDNVKEFKRALSKDKYTFIVFVSPSGDGLKLIVKIPANIQTHKLSCKALKEYYKTEKLDNFEDIARVCYESYDPEIFVNSKSLVFHEKAKEEIKKEVVKGIETNIDIIFENLVTGVEKKDHYSDGNKHNFIVKIAGACNYFGIPEYLAAQKIIYKYQSTASYVKSKDFEDIVSRVYRSYSHDHNTAHFEKTGIAYNTKTKVKLSETFFNEIDVFSKDIIKLESVKKSMLEGFVTGKAKGKTTYFKEFDNHWKWRRKELTFVSGISNMGKSTFILQLALLRALKEGEKFGIFSPEQDPADDLYNDLIHMLVGKSTEPDHHNQMSMIEYEKAMEFIGNHFFYVHPSDASPTPDYINKCFEVLIDKYNIDGCITDPFNQLDNDWRKFNRDDLYISEFLGKEKRFAQVHNVYKIIVGHPVGGKLKKDSQGDYEKPNIYDYAGGSMWANKCDNILLYHRPYASSNPQHTLCQWISQKIKKRKLVGVPGTLDIYFDVMQNRFKDENGNSPFEKTEEFDFSDVEDIPF